MTPDQIIWNGRIGSAEQCGTDIGHLLNSDYVYQRIHVHRHQALHAEAHLRIVNHALQSIHNTRIELSADQLREDIRKFFTVNHYPAPSNEITLYVFPHHPADPFSPPTYLIGGATQLLYPLYKVWHTRPILSLYPCDYPYMGYLTAISQRIASFSSEWARREGANVAVIENFDGVLTNVEDEPLFLVRGKDVTTSPRTDGATDSVMRRLVLKACANEGIQISERNLTRDMLLTCDEVFTPTTQGLVCMSEYAGRSYFNLTAHKLIAVMNHLTKSELQPDF